MNEKETNNGSATAALKLLVTQPAFNSTFPGMSKKGLLRPYRREAVKAP